MVLRFYHLMNQLASPTTLSMPFQRSAIRTVRLNARNDSRRGSRSAPKVSKILPPRLRTHFQLTLTKSTNQFANAHQRLPTKTRSRLTVKYTGTKSAGETTSPSLTLRSAGEVTSLSPRFHQLAG